VRLVGLRHLQREPRRDLAAARGVRRRALRLARALELAALQVDRHQLGVEVRANLRGRDLRGGGLGRVRGSVQVAAGVLEPRAREPDRPGEIAVFELLQLLLRGGVLALVAECARLVERAHQLGVRGVAGARAQRAAGGERERGEHRAATDVPDPPHAQLRI